MRKLKALGAASVVVTLCVFPAVGALFQLGAALAAIDRMHHAHLSEGASSTRETIGTYEVDPATMNAGHRLHDVRVSREVPQRK
jgi:hypothetical protein